MIKPSVKSALAVLAIASPFAMAQGLPKNNLNPALSYNFLGLRYVDQDLDNFNCGQSGLNVYGNYDYKEGFFATASLSDVSGDTCGSSSLSAGAGYRTPFNDMFDMFATISLETMDPDVGSSDTGLAATGGIRGFVAQNVEAKLELAHHTVGSGETLFNASGLYWFNQQFTASLDFSYGSDSSMIGIGARMKF